MLAAREVLIGSSNEKFLVIREGLTEGQEVVMNPRAHLEEVGLPAVDIESPKVAQRDESSKSGDRPQTDGGAAATASKPPAKAASAPAADAGTGG